MKLDAKALLARYQPRAVGKPIVTDFQLASLRFSPDGKFLAGGDFEGNVRLWDASGATPTALPSLTGHHGWVQAIAFQIGGPLLYTADSWGKLAAWTYAAKPTTPTWSHEKAHDGWIRKVVLSPDGMLLATAGSDGFVRLWTTGKGEKKQEWKHSQDIMALAFAADGKSVVQGDLMGVIERRDIATGKVLQTYDAKQMHISSRLQEVGGVRCLAFDPSGKILAAAGCIPNNGGNVQGMPLILYFDAATGKLLHSAKFGTINDGYVYDLHWHADGFVMGVTSGQPGQGKMAFHQPGDEAPFFLAPKMANCHVLAVHPNGKQLIVSATNTGSSGNGRPLTKEKKYPGNYSPLHIWEIQKS